jgi:hypothetical protein
MEHSNGGSASHPLLLKTQGVRVWTRLPYVIAQAESTNRAAASPCQAPFLRIRHAHASISTVLPLWFRVFKAVAAVYLLKMD